MQLNFSTDLFELLFTYFSVSSTHCLLKQGYYLLFALFSCFHQAFESMSKHDIIHAVRRYELRVRQEEDVCASKQNSGLAKPGL